MNCGSERPGPMSHRQNDGKPWEGRPDHANRRFLFCSERLAWHPSFVSRIVGIDLGTTNSLVAIVDAGIPLVIADDEGQRLTPSVVHIPGANAEPVVGRKANRVR